jgi:hypothetical protein
MEKRQPQSCPGTGEAPVAISRVTPPPFFHGTTGISDARIRRVEELGIAISFVICALPTAAESSTGRKALPVPILSRSD